ncbi:hypothetical protein EBT16_04445 [bacterium]|nr:hypothetical protein [bacterium]
MDRLKPATVADAREFFASELRITLHNHGVSARPSSFDYLVELLVKCISSESFFRVNTDGNYEDTLLFDLYVQYTQSPREQQMAILQRMGDLCLVMSGYFGESLQSKLVDIDYYFGMGGTAYQTLSELENNKQNKGVYKELSGKFQPFSNVLGEMGERTGLQSNKDILRLYERWMATGSDRLRKLLSEQGIQPVVQSKLAKQ